MEQIFVPGRWSEIERARVVGGGGGGGGDCTSLDAGGGKWKSGPICPSLSLRLGFGLVLVQSVKTA